MIRMLIMMIIMMPILMAILLIMVIIIIVIQIIIIIITNITTTNMVYNVDIQFTAMSCLRLPGVPVLLPIVLGSVIGVVFLILFVLVIVLIAKKVKQHSTESSVEDSNASHTVGGNWHRPDRLFWQTTGGEGMRSLPRVTRVEYARMKANSAAMEPFATVSVTTQFVN